MENGPSAELSDIRAVSAVKRFRVVAVIAGLVCAPFALVHLVIALSVVPNVSEMFLDMGGDYPSVYRALISLSANGVLPVLLVAIDAAIFYALYVCAKRYWIGLLFVPVFVYMAISSAMYLLLYAPMFSVIQLVQ